MGLPHEAHRTNPSDDVQSPEFLSLNPYNNIPATIDPGGPDGAPIGLLDVVEQRLERRDWLQRAIDITMAPWLFGPDYYGARDLIGWDDYLNLIACLGRFHARPAVERGKTIPAAPA